MWFPKFPYTNFSQINLDWVLRQIKELSEWMNRYFKDIRQDLDDEINNRIEGDKALGERIDQEIADRTEADQQLQNNIDAEEAAREAADTALGGRIDKEIQDRTEADNALGQRIDTETAERKAADQQLQGNIDTLRDDAILKDGSTTTTAAIPFAQGIKTPSITNPDGSAPVTLETGADLSAEKITNLAQGTEPTDAVNLEQMQTADEAAITEANSYTDTQLEAISAEIHSIPAGGNSGQVLAKVDETNYNVTWVDQQGGGSGGDVPAGGTTGQVLAKSTDADYQTEWINQPEGLPAGGTEGQILTKSADAPVWSDAPSGLPSGGTTGQVVTKTDGGAEWADVPPNFKLIETSSGVELWSDGEFALIRATENKTIAFTPTTGPTQVGTNNLYYTAGTKTYPDIKFTNSYYMPIYSSTLISKDAAFASSYISYSDYYINPDGTISVRSNTYRTVNQSIELVGNIGETSTKYLYKISKKQ